MIAIIWHTLYINTRGPFPVYILHVALEKIEKPGEEATIVVAIITCVINHSQQILNPHTCSSSSISETGSVATQPS